MCVTGRQDSPLETGRTCVAVPIMSQFLISRKPFDLLRAGLTPPPPPSAYIRRPSCPPAPDPLQSFGVVVFQVTRLGYCSLCCVDGQVRW